MAKRTKKLSRPQLKLEALEQRQLLAGITGGGTEVGSDIHHANGNVYDQVLMTGASVTITADAGQVTRVSFLDLQGDIVQAEFSGKGQLTISLDQFVKDVAPANYNQDGVKYSQGLASFTVSGSDSSTNFAVFSVGKGNAVNAALFDPTHQGGDHTADIARLTIVADPANPNGSDFGAIYAGNAKFSADSGVVGITASNVQVQNAVRIGDVDAKTSATPTLVFGTHSQFAAIDVGGGDLISTNGKSINNNGSYEYGVNLLAGTDSAGTTLPAQIAVPPFTAHDPFAGTAAKTLSLTVGNDSGSLFVGTAGDDTYIAAIGANGVTSNGTSLNAGDSLNGGGGNDTLNISISGTNTGADQTTSSFTANNIEWLSIANFQTDDAFNSVLDLAGMPQIKGVTINSSAASGDTSLTSVQGLVSATMKNGGGDLSLSYADAVIAGATTQSLAVSGQTGGTFTAGGIETLNITSSTTANTVTVAGGDLVTVNVSGDKGLTLGTLPASVTKVDGSALTAGSLKVTGNTANDYNLKGGAGDDTFTISTGYSNADSVDGGAGTDTLSISTTVVTSAGLKNVSNVEVLKMTGATNVTLDNNVSATTIDLTDSANAHVLTLGTNTPSTSYTNATTVNLTGAGAAGSDIADTVANVALTVNAKDTDIQAGNSLAAGSATTDTINLKSDGGTADLTNVSGFEKIVVTGSSDSTISFGPTNNVVASGKTLTIDGSALTGKLTITNTGSESDGLLNITGGSADDALAGGTSGKDTLIAGAGDDTLTLGAVTATNVVTGGDGSDTLFVTGTDIADAGKLVGVTGVETLKLGGSVDVTLAAPITATTGITSINISDTGHTANVVTLKSGFTDAMTVTLTGDGNVGNKVDNQANVALTIVGDINDVGTNVSIVGGSGTDVMNLKANGGTAALDNVSGVETITIGQNSALVTDDAVITLPATDTVIAAGKTLKIDASALADSNATLTFNSAVATQETNGYFNVIGGAGADTIGGGGSGFDTLIGGGGNDDLRLSSLSATNSIDGGAGSDKLTVSSAISNSSAFLGVTNVETLVLTGAASNFGYTSNIKTATGIATINIADANAQTITIGSGVTDTVAVVLSGDTNHADKIDNSAGNTTLTVTANVADITAGVTVLGGTGTDTLALKADDGTAVLTNVSGVETITIAKNTAVKTATVNVGGANGTVASGKVLTVDGSGMDGAFSFTGTGETDGSFALKGGSAADTFVGGSQADTFTGGSGADTFTLSTNASKLTFDTITDLSTGDIIAGGGDGSQVFNNTKLVLGGLATFSDYLDQAASATDGATNGVFRWFQFNGNTYVVEDLSNNATFTPGVDRVIEISGTKTLASASTGDSVTITVS